MTPGIYLIPWLFAVFQMDVICETHFLTVNIKNGTLQGKYIHLSETETVRVFLGVPYARPPVGELRFKPPQPSHGWKGILNTTKFGPICPQPFSLPPVCKMWTSPVKGEIVQSEDCLTLNIYTPQIFGNETFPVLLFVHGGSYATGAGLMVSGEKLASKGSVVVTVNYRLGILGFLSTGDKICPGNYGLLDQVQALRWIQENIASFNGNPQNVNLIGQSAGGSCVALHMLSPLTKGLFSKVIAQSGSALASWAVQSNPKFQSKRLADRLNCSKHSSAAIVECLKTKTIDVFKNNTAIGTLFQIFWAPVVDGPNGFLPDTPQLLIKAQKVHKLPFITGVTKDEASAIIYGKEDSHEPRDNITRNLIVRTVIPSLLNDAQYPNRGVLSEVLEFLYLDSLTTLSLEVLRQQYELMLTDAIFGAPCIEIAKQFSGAGIPTYLYVLDYHSKNDSYPEWAGAYHGIDLKLLFGCSFYPNSNKFTALNDKHMSDFMMKLWINFANVGNPTHQFIHQATSYHYNQWTWELYNEKTQYFFNISLRPDVRRNYRHEFLTFWNKVLPNLISIGITPPSANKLYEILTWVLIALVVILLIIFIVVIIFLSERQKKIVSCHRTSSS